MTFLQKFLRSNSGATAIEYGMIVALLSVICILAYKAIGTKLNTTYTNASTGLN